MSNKLKLIIGGWSKNQEKVYVAREQIKNLLQQIETRNKMVLQKANDYVGYISESEYDKLVCFTQKVRVALKDLQGD